MIPEHLAVSLGHGGHSEGQDAGIWAEEQVYPFVDDEPLRPGRRDTRPALVVADQQLERGRAAALTHPQPTPAVDSLGPESQPAPRLFALRCESAGQRQDGTCFDHVPQPGRPTSLEQPVIAPEGSDAHAVKSSDPSARARIAATAADTGLSPVLGMALVKSAPGQGSVSRALSSTV